MLLAAAGSCWVAAVGAGSPAPTLAEVQRAYAQAHPYRRPACDPENLFFSLEAPQNVVACRPDEAELTFYYRGRATSLEQAQYGRDYYHFRLLQGGREAGLLVAEPFIGDNPAALDLFLGARLRSTLGNLPDVRLRAVGDTSFARAVRLMLAQGPLVPAPSYFTAPVLNDKGYALQQLGCQAEALQFFNEVLRRYPTRAVTYLNRGDAHWAQHQPAAAQADYRRYLALLRTQRKDTTRVPAYMRLALRLPTTK